jgi:F0F1-type ATP synthase membrane subunit b/b'
MDIFASLGIQPDVLAAQIINLLILFVIFKFAIGKKLQKGIEKRRALIKKLEHADEAYAEKIAQASKEAEKIIQEGLAKKDELIAEGGALATKIQKDASDSAQSKARKIIEDAEIKAKILEDEMSKSFSSGVKQVAALVVKKLIGDQPDIQSKYVDAIVSDFSQSMKAK